MKNWIQVAAVTTVVLAAVSFGTHEAQACGGCFVPPEENTQVTGHRMVMSIGMDQSTLVDQIVYTGSPESFAWVLPIRGKVDIGLSSDLIFNQLGFQTTVAVRPPPLNCPIYNCGQDSGSEFSASASSGGAGGGSGGGGVDVIAQGTVGPYETVQLDANGNAQALSEWLGLHGFQLPSSIEPIVADYVADGFNFLALKLLPGVGIDRIQPVRVTTQGAGIELPLKMVAAGTGAVTTMTLWVLGQGRYETDNFPNFVIAPEAHVWNYDEGRSNRSDLVAKAYAASNGHAWHTEAAIKSNAGSIRSSVLNVVDFGAPDQNGYSIDLDEARALAEADLDVLLQPFSSQGNGAMWVTRLRAELSRSALTKDLRLAASDKQEQLPLFVQCTNFVGTQPACPPPPPGCKTGDSTGNDPLGTSATSESGGCSVGQRGNRGIFGGGLSLLLLLGLSRRRRKTS